MKRLILWLTLFTALLALAACAAEEKATPSPSTAPTAAGKPAWEQEWERVLAAAKQEGKLSLMMPTGAATRQPLTEPFEKKYGITVEYQQGSGAEQIQKVRAERAAGQYLWDLWIGGHTDMIVAKNQGMLDPMEAALILPEVKDSKNWLGGKMEFSDNEGKFVLIMGAYSGANIMVNTDLVDPKTITSYRDLLDPKWKGKILMDDPRIGGSANSSFGFFYQNKALGPDFIKALLAQDITYNRDNELQLQWLAQGKYPICIGCSTRRAAQMKNEGVKNIGEAPCMGAPASFPYSTGLPIPMLPRSTLTGS